MLEVDLFLFRHISVCQLPLITLSINCEIIVSFQEHILFTIYFSFRIFAASNVDFINRKNLTNNKSYFKIYPYIFKISWKLSHSSQSSLSSSQPTAGPPAPSTKSTEPPPTASGKASTTPCTQDFIQMAKPCCSDRSQRNCRRGTFPRFG